MVCDRPISSAARKTSSIDHLPSTFSHQASFGLGGAPRRKITAASSDFDSGKTPEKKITTSPMKTRSNSNRVRTTPQRLYSI